MSDQTPEQTDTQELNCWIARARSAEALLAAEKKRADDAVEVADAYTDHLTALRAELLTVTGERDGERKRADELADQCEIQEMLLTRTVKDIRALKVERDQLAAEVAKLTNDSKCLEEFCRDATMLAMEIVWGGKPGEATTPDAIYIAGIGGVRQAFDKLKAQLAEQAERWDKLREAVEKELCKAHLMSFRIITTTLERVVVLIDSLSTPAEPKPAPSGESVGERD